MKKRKLLLLLLCAAMVISLTACDSRDYKTAQSLAESGDWAAARELFVALEDYEDSAAMVTECDYRLALEAMDAGQFDDAILAFTELGDYKDSADMIRECLYRTAVAYYDAGEFENALNSFLVEELQDYKETDHYTTLALLQIDQQAFVDLMSLGMNGYFADNSIPMQLTENSSGKEQDARFFTITDIYDVANVRVTFAPSNGEGSITTDGQINYMNVCADSYNKTIRDTVAEQYFLASGAMMTTLVDGTDAEEFAALMAEQLGQTVDSSAESIESGSSAFEYAGYNCRVSVTDFGDDIIRLVFSVTIPELVG